MGRDGSVTTEVLACICTALAVDVNDICETAKELKMIRDTREHNENVNPNDFKVERLHAALPEYFDGDGNFMIDRLEEALRGGRDQSYA